MSSLNPHLVRSYNMYPYYYYPIINIAVFFMALHLYDVNIYPMSITIDFLYPI